MNNDAVNQFMMFSVEALMIVLLLLGLFRIRSRLGLFPLYVALGVFQPIQVLLASSIYVEILPNLVISPGSAVIFTASLFTILLVYIREDAIEARKVIYGIMIANLTMTLLLLVFGVQLGLPDTLNFLDLPRQIFNQGARVMLAGTVALFGDVILVIFVYEAIRRFIPRVPFLRIYLTMAIILTFDTLVFATGAFYGQPNYSSIVLAGIVGKVGIAAFYAAALIIYLRFMEPVDRLSSTASQPFRDIFYALTYREKYEIERERAEEAVRESEEKIRAIFNSVNDAIFVQDGDTGEILDVNRRMCEMFSYTHEETLKLSIGELSSGEPGYTQADAMDWIKKARGGQAQLFEWHCKKKNGQLFWAEINMRSAAIGGNEQILVVVRDITARKQTERALRESLSRSEALFEYAAIPIWEEDFSEVKKRLDHLRNSGVNNFEKYFQLQPDEIKHIAGLVDVRDVNQKSLEFYQVPDKEELETSLPNWFKEDSLQVFREEIIALATGADRFESEIPVCTPQGEIKYLHVNLSILPDHKEPWDRIFVSFIDITERKRAEEALRSSEEKFSKAFHSSPDIIGINSIPDGRLIEVNEAFEKITGFRREEVIGKTTVELNIWVNPEDMDRYSQEIKQRGKVRNMEVCFRIKNQEVITSLLSAETIKLDGHVCLLFVIKDITERKRAEEKLRFTQFAVDRVADCIYWVMPDARFFYVNDAACHALGYTREELLSMKVHDIDPNFPAEAWPEFWKEVRERVSFIIEGHHRTKDSRVFPVEIRVNYIAFEGNEYTCAFVRDSTERKRAEETLRESEARYRGLFEDSPISLWEEDFSAIKTYLSSLRDSGITDFRIYFENNPEAVPSCMAMAKIVDVNVETLKMLQAGSKKELLRNITQVFGRESYSVFQEVLISLAEGKKGFQTEDIDQKLYGNTLHGNTINVSMKLSVSPNYEDTWSKVFISLTDISKRVQAEDRVRREASRAEALLHLAARLNAQLDLRAALDTMCEEVASALSVPAASVSLYDEKRNVLYHGSDFGLPPEYRQRVQSVPVPGELSDGSIRQPGPFIVTSDTQALPGKPNADLYTELGIRSIASAGLMRENQLIGTINIHALEEPRAFGEDELALLKGLADQGVQAIINARLHQQLQRYATELEQRVSERTKDLRKANTKLKELDRLKSMFIASMSHELRTPLNSIIGFTGVILQGMAGEINAEQKDQLQRVYNSAKHLLALISDVIDISKIEAGKIEPYPEKFQLDGVVKDAVSSLKPQIEGKGLSLEISLPQDLQLTTDRKRLLQCILNYLSNAVKYTEKGKMSITAHQVNEKVEIMVKDTGIGIKKKDLSKLFNSFVRLDSPLNLKTLGTGLGLYLTKKLAVEVLNGSVSVASRYGKGSEFTLKVAKEL